MNKVLPAVLVLIAIVFGASYLHESKVTSEVQDEIRTSLGAPAR